MPGHLIFTGVWNSRPPHGLLTCVAQTVLDKPSEFTKPSPIMAAIVLLVDHRLPGRKARGFLGNPARWSPSLSVCQAARRSSIADEQAEFRFDRLKAAT